MSRTFVVSAAFLIAAAAFATWSFDSATADTGVRPRDASEILLGRPYDGATLPTPRDAGGRPVLTGYWKLLHEAGKPDGNLGKDRADFRLPYTEKGSEVLAGNYETVDPEARCIITGIPRLLTTVLPFEILHTPQRLGTFHALGWHRWVWLDGRTREASEDPRYLGNAIGRWEQDTLVIESTGFQDSAEGNVWLDDNANPISGQATVIERWTRPDFYHLNLELTYSDPVYYSEPISYRRHWVLGKPDEGLSEFSCEWNTPWVVTHLEPGPGAIGADGNRGFGPDNQIVPDLPLGSVDDARGTGYWLYRKNKPKPSELLPE